MSLDLRNRRIQLARGVYRGRRGLVNWAQNSAFNPLTSWTTDPVHGVWASDPLWTPPADGGAVSAWRNGGSAYTSGAYIGADGLVLPGVSGNYASTPDAAWCDIGDDFRIEVFGSMATGAVSQGLMGSTNQWFFWRSSGGKLCFTIPSVVDIFATVTLASVGLNDGVVRWWAVEKVSGSPHTYTFEYSTDGVSWTQIGAAVTHAGNVGTTGVGVRIGSNPAVASSGLSGTVKRARVIDSGVTVFDADFSAATEGISAFTESSSNAATVTVVSSQNPAQATGSAQPTYRAATVAFNGQPTVQGDGVDDFLQATWGAAVVQPLYVVMIGSKSKAANASEPLFDDSLVAGGQTVLYTLTGASTWRLYSGVGPITGGTADTSPHQFTCKFNGGSSALLVDGALTASGNAGTEGQDGLTLFRYVTTSVFSGGHVAYWAVFNTDPTALPEWATFKAWVTSFYGITVA